MAVVASAFALVVVGCADGDDTSVRSGEATTTHAAGATARTTTTDALDEDLDEARDEMVESLAHEFGMEQMPGGSEEMGDCMAGAVIDAVGIEQLVEDGVDAGDFGEAGSLGDLGYDLDDDEVDALAGEIGDCMNAEFLAALMQEMAGVEYPEAVAECVAEPMGPVFGQMFAEIFARGGEPAIPDLSGLMGEVASCRYEGKPDTADSARTLDDGRDAFEASVVVELTTEVLPGTPVMPEKAAVCLAASFVDTFGPAALDGVTARELARYMAGEPPSGFGLEVDDALAETLADAFLACYPFEEQFAQGFALLEGGVAGEIPPAERAALFECVRGAVDEAAIRETQAQVLLHGAAAMGDLMAKSIAAGAECGKELRRP